MSKLASFFGGGFYYIVGCFSGFMVGFVVSFDFIVKLFLAHFTYCLTSDCCLGLLKMICLFFSLAEGICLGCKEFGGFLLVIC